ncbi:MAG: formylglycine-generating enzyme family protein [Chthoniobacteraceae bacterium]|nr:formylglycine-generating enzyme family protein [Chthoniobacteraceae bacterium]
MGLFDFLFESVKSMAAGFEEQNRARQEQENRARQEQETAARTNWFKQHARVESISIFKKTVVDFCYVPPGQFKMGDAKVDVTLSTGFWLARVPVTHGVWKAVTGESPSNFEGNPDLPLESVSWDDCARFIGLLKKSLVLEGTKYRFDFPTEAQWEYACRAGSVGPYAVEKFWCGQQHPFPVGQLPGNALGLQDMHGNVSEWCRDVYQGLPGGNDPCVLPPPLPEPPAIRPRGWRPPPPWPVDRVRRGGSWNDGAALCSAAYRTPYRSDLRYNSIGFRLALVPSL